MALLLVIVFGAIVGYRLGMTRPGFLTLGAVSLVASVGQVGHLATTSDRSWMTLWPLVLGTMVVAGMLMGAVARRVSSPASGV